MWSFSGFFKFPIALVIDWTVLQTTTIYGSVIFSLLNIPKIVSCISTSFIAVILFETLKITFMGLFSFLRSTQPRRWRFSSKYCALKSYEWDKTRNLRNGLPSAYLDLYLQTETYQWVIKLVSVYAHFNATPIMNSPKGAVCRSNWANRLYRISDKTERAWALPEFHLRPWFCSTAMIWGTAHNCQDLVCSGPRMLTGPIPKCGKADIIFKHEHFGFGFPPPNSSSSSYCI